MTGESRIPSPPSGSCFTLEHDTEGRPRLAWQPPAERGRWLTAAFPLCWLALWAISEVFVLSTLIQDLLNGGGLEEPFMLLWLAGWTFGGLMVARWVRAVVRSPGMERLTLAEEELRYECDRPGARDADEMSFSVVQPERSPRPPAHMSRVGIKEVRLDRHAGRQRLRLRRAGRSVEFGKHLREPEREWLADVLRAWLDPATQPASDAPGPPAGPEITDGADDDPAALADRPADRPDPPPNSWIRAEPAGDGGRRLRWMPFPERRVNWTRWGSLVRTAFMLIGWCIPAALLGGLWLMVAAHIVHGAGAGGMQMVFHGPVGMELFVLAFLTPFVVLIGLFGYGIAATLWALVKPFRPESLTLGPSGLRYDPGHFVAGEHANSGRPRDMPRSELGRIRLEHFDGRQRLTFDHGVERVEVGTCLREPEREWLAEVFRRWAGRAEAG